MTCSREKTPLRWNFIQTSEFLGASVQNMRSVTVSLTTVSYTNKDSNLVGLKLVKATLLVYKNKIVRSKCDDVAHYFVEDTGTAVDQCDISNKLLIHWFASSLQSYWIYTENVLIRRNKTTFRVVLYRKRRLTELHVVTTLLSIGSGLQNKLKNKVDFDFNTRGQTLRRGTSIEFAYFRCKLFGQKSVIRISLFSTQAFVVWLLVYL